MARPFTSDMSAAVAATVVRIGLLAVFEFDSGTVYAWTGIGDLVWNGNTYKGVGTLVGIGTMAEVSDGSASGMKFTLSGVALDQLALALTESYQGRPAQMYLALFDSSWALIASPYQFFAGSMDVMTIQDGVKNATITLTVENGLIELDRPRERRFTDQDQQLDFPGDLFFQFVNSIQIMQLYWGDPNGPQNIPGAQGLGPLNPSAP